jgi:CubicO group peptidase (beta-lactamase class C family)
MFWTPALAAPRLGIWPADGQIARLAKSFLAANPQCPGIALGYTKGGNNHSGGFGHVTLGGSRGPDAATIYPIASISKTFAGVLLAQASLEGKLGLDDDVRGYLDGDYPNLAFAGEPIRLWQLLNHNSGLPFSLPDLPSTRPPFPAPDAEAKVRIASYTRANFLRDLHEVKLTAKPGAVFSYSNAAATLLSFILERVHRAPFDRLIQQEICRPLGMRETGILLRPALAGRLAPGYDEAGKIAPPIDDRLLGAGAIKSSVRDMLAYARWHMEESDAAVRLSHAPHPIDGNYSIGLNWQMMSGPEGRCIWQEGSLPGYSSMCVVLPESRAAFVAFINKLDRPTNQAFGAFTRQALALIAPGATKLP